MIWQERRIYSFLGFFSNFNSFSSVFKTAIKINDSRVKFCLIFERKNIFANSTCNNFTQTENEVQN